jgi:hypothetical protein
VSGGTRALLVGLALVAMPAAARAAPCPESWAASLGPLPAGVGPADFGAVPEACPGSELTLRLRGTLLVASAAPDFFGSVAAGAMLRARHPLARRAWISFALDAVTFRYVANAVVTSSGLAVGPPTIGIYRALGDRPELAVALYGRVLLPFDTARQSGVETGLEAGLAARFTPRARVGLDGGLAVAAPVDVVGGQVHPFLRPAALVEGWWAPRPCLGLFAGAEGRFQAAPDPSFTSIAPRAAARFALRHGLSLALLVEVPVAGSDRTDLVAGLYASWAPP